MKKKIFIVGLLILSVFLTSAKKSKKANSKYVASTSWVAAIAQLAGIDEIDTIAPAELKHPPEYEITPNDILKVSKADLFIYAGYEAMMNTISTATKIDKQKIVKISTKNQVDVLEAAVTLLAEKAGTQEKANQRFSEYKQLITNAREKVKSKCAQRLSVYVNTNQLPLAQDLGLNIIGTFGPSPLTSAQIAEIAKNKPDIIIDNVHNPVAAPAKQVSESSVIIEWRNFPDTIEGDNLLYNVVFKNIELLFSSYDMSSLAEPKDLKILKQAYPDVTFESEYDSEKNDYLITVSVEDRQKDFYWANGKLLPESELSNEKNYRSVFYEYPDKIPDPQYFTDEYIQQIKDATSFETRQNGDELSYFFYDLLYQSDSRKTVEKRIGSYKFLGKYPNVHDRIKEPLARVEKKIMELSKEDNEVREFLEKLLSVDCYNWRDIEDSGKKSVHSFGIALDVLPKGWGQKNVYWAWRRDIDKENWMKLSLDRRWTPPEKVIEIFEQEGFVYGGKWMVWDNMHFEYFPEVILYNKLVEK